MSIPFEESRSYVYRATRYEILPVIEQKAEVYGQNPFLLRDLTKQVLEERYTEEQLEIQIKKAESEKMEKMRTIFSFYVPFLADNLQVFDRVGGGLFKNISIDEEVAEADAETADIENDDAGFIYAYTFPSIERTGGAFPIKVGLTMGGNPDERVLRQCRQTCCFEHPKILAKWEVQRVAAVESAIHSTLEARGCKRDAPGTEWFDTTIPEITKIVEFVGQSI